MADESKSIDLIIRALLDSRGFQEVRGEIEKLESKRAEAAANSKKHSETEALGFDQVKEKLLELAAEYLAVREAFDFLKESFQDAVQQEQLFSQLAATIRVVAKGTDEEVEATERWVESMGLAYGKTDKELVPALQNLVTVTGDVGSAQALMKIALDASKAGFGDLATMTNTLGKELITGHIRAGTPFNNMLLQLVKASEKAHHGHADHKEILTELAVKMQEMATHTNTTANALDQQKVRWEHTREAIGRLGLTLVTEFEPAMKVGAVAISMVVAGLLNLAAAGRYALDLFLLPERVSEYQKKGLGIIAATKAAMHDANENFAQLSGKGTKVIGDVLEAWDHQTVAIGQGKKAQEAALAAVANQWDHAGEKAKSAADIQAAAIKKINEQYDILLGKAKLSITDEQKLALEEEKIYKSKAAQFAAGSKEEIDALLKAQEAHKRYEAAVKQAQDDASAAAKKAADQRAKIFDIEEQRRLLGMKKNTAGELVELRKREAQMLADLKNVGSNVDEEIKIREHLLENERKIGAAEKTLSEQKIAQRKKELGYMKAAAGAGVEVSKAAFGENKGIQVAEAIINGINAAIESFNNGGGYPEGLVPMAASIVTSGAQIVEMQGTGFDDPNNDLLMRGFARQWATDMAREVTTGLTNGWASGLQDSRRGSASTVINSIVNNPGATQRTSITHVHALPLVNTASEPMVKDLGRQLDVAKRHNKQGIVS